MRRSEIRRLSQARVLAESLRRMRFFRPSSNRYSQFSTPAKIAASSSGAARRRRAIRRSESAIWILAAIVEPWATCGAALLSIGGVTCALDTATFDVPAEVFEVLDAATGV